MLAAALAVVSCGSSRHLESITIAQTVNDEHIQFVATGNFSSAPTTVTPLAEDWGVGPFAPPPAGKLAYELTTQPFSFQCQGFGALPSGNGLGTSESKRSSEWSRFL
jgi:hypothetical protein